MQAPFEDGAPALHDAWERTHPGEAHPTTFKLHEKLVPGEAELHCDFVFVNEPVVSRLRSVVVDRQTQASYHQPVTVTLT